MSWTVLLILLAVGVVVGVAIEWRRHIALRVFGGRPCAGVRWRRQYRWASADDIRGFLSLFVDAFGFPARHRLRLRPTDRVMDVYHALNPPNWTLGDAMDFEMLAEEIARVYGLPLEDHWHDQITLGELFEHACGRAR